LLPAHLNQVLVKPDAAVLEGYQDAGSTKLEDANLFALTDLVSLYLPLLMDPVYIKSTTCRLDVS
jgi:hypothetical protein